jgi:hypothetical protein
VQVFGRRDDDTLDGLRRPAAEKRQGTKSRWVVRGGCRGRYGDFAAGFGVVGLERFGRRTRLSVMDGVGPRWKCVDRRLDAPIDGVTADQFGGPMRV